MIAVASEKVDVYRGTTVNAYGDEVSVQPTDDGATPIATDVLLSVAEQRKTVRDEASGQIRTIRTLVGRVPNQTDVQRSDLLYNGTTVWLVEEITVPSNPVLPDLDLRLDLSRVT